MYALGTVLVSGIFYQFYLIEHYGLSIKNAQYFVFAFMIAGVLGTFFGGPLADRFGKKTIIVFSMLGSAPLALLLPHVFARVGRTAIFMYRFY